MIVLKMHKIKKDVEIPLMNEALNLLPKHEGLQNERIFKVCANQVFNRNLKEIINLAGIKKNISHHCARHTFATLAFENGIPVEIISKILGHSTTKVTMFYAKIQRKSKIKAMESFNSMLVEEGVRKFTIEF